MVVTSEVLVHGRQVKLNVGLTLEMK